MQKICFATNNPNKVAEVQSLLGDSIRLLGLKDIGCTEELPETTDTIEGNSRQKAEYVWQHYKYSCFADDTGLEVSALGNAPGVHTAYYGGAQRNNHANMDLLLANLACHTDRSAQFRTVITLVLEGEVYQFEGVAKGIIAHEKSGSEGFGYDPIFIPDGYATSFAEMGMAEKNKISHRAKAVEKTVRFLESIGR